MVGVAVKVTEAPEQTVVRGVAIDIDGVTVASTVIVTELDVAGLPVTPDRLEVMTQVTTEPVASVVVV